MLVMMMIDEFRTLQGKVRGCAGEVYVHPGEGG